VIINFVFSMVLLYLAFVTERDERAWHIFVAGNAIFFVLWGVMVYRIIVAARRVCLPHVPVSNPMKGRV
jgi:predicted lysophospholipase L1 biosynthesis ABC-type transport system permease subunit